ncbi:MAG: LamG-like jellyroll fold domain-containing protein [Isosphaeraceae bacterium]
MMRRQLFDANQIIPRLLVFGFMLATAEAQTQPLTELVKQESGQLKTDQPKRIAFWPLQTNAEFAAGSDVKRSTALGLGFEAGPAERLGKASVWNGRNSLIEASVGPELEFGREAFSVSLWLNLDGADDDLPGDLVNHFDHDTQTGWSLAVTGRSGLVHNQSNHRQIAFGINDNRHGSAWVDHGRPGQAVYVHALAVHDGQLFAGTCDPGAGRQGGVFRFEPPDRWINTAAPVRANAVTSLAVYQGELYAGTGKYRLAGSALEESKNETPGGEILKLSADGTWSVVGKLPETEAVGGLVVFQGKLHASSLYRPAGFFRMEGPGNWASLPTPGGKRPEAMAVHNNKLYASGYDEGHVYEYDGRKWSDLGPVGTNTQTYGFAVYRGGLYVSTWPEGKVYRHEGATRWADCGRLGESLEVMGLAVHNGSLFGGTLPSAEVYRYLGGQKWLTTGKTDPTPDVKYRRAWSMAEFQGRLFCGTLPSGHVYSYQSGLASTIDKPVGPGWHHVVAVRDAKSLRLYLDGTLAAEAASPKAGEINVSAKSSLKIGHGVHDNLRGRLRDVAIYRGTLSAGEISRLHDGRDQPEKP